MSDWIAGIDPGLAGGVALLDPEGRVRGAWDIPCRIETRADGSTRGRVDAPALAGILKEVRDVSGWNVDWIWIEAVSAAPGQGVAAAFAFGRGLGAIEAVCALEGFEVRAVAPTAWKRALRVPADKRGAMARAGEIFGGDRYWPLRKNEGRAEAALIARFGQLSGKAR